MNSYFPNLLLNGFVLCLFLQLLAVGSINLAQKQLRQSILGTYCIFLTLTFIYTLYWPNMRDNVFYNIIFGGFKEAFFPALTYLYLALSANPHHQKRLVLKHLLAPLIISATYLVLKFTLIPFSASSLYITTGVYLFMLSSYLFYVILSIALFRNLKTTLKANIYKRYRLFYGVVVTFGVLLLMQYLLQFGMDHQAYSIFFEKSSFYFYPFLALFSTIYILVFVVLETPSLKPLLLGNKIYKNERSITNSSKIASFLQNYTLKSKEYLTIEEDLKTALEREGISNSDFKIYLRSERDQSYRDFINSIKTEQFKTKILDPQNNIFDIASIAEMSGFTSKATFYRIFKAKEGMTPQQFREQNTP
jgi:AraC-like DNA-binding protein